MQCVLPLFSGHKQLASQILANSLNTLIEHIMYKSSARIGIKGLLHRITDLANLSGWVIIGKHTVERLFKIEKSVA